MPRSALLFVLCLILSVGIAKVVGTWPFDGTVPAAAGREAPEAPAPDQAEPAEPGAPLPAAVDGVRTLYDDLWTVEEGQWWIPGLPEEADVAYHHVLESSGDAALAVTLPGLYGRYRTVVTLHERAPAVPGWCQDAAEASLRIPTGGAFTMGSFETFADAYDVPAGWYRVRYCTEDQDLAAVQEEFTGDEYTTYKGRHLIQLWRAPREPDRTILSGSHWAQQLAE